MYSMVTIAKYCMVFLKVVKRVNIKCSHYTYTHTHYAN